MTIGQHMYNGMGAAAWLLGFLILFAGTVLAIILIVYGVMLLAGLKGKPGQRKGVNRNAGTPAIRYQPSGYARPVGRHVRTRP